MKDRFREDWILRPGIFVVRQTAERGCGLACGEMLFADRNVIVTQQQIGEGLHVPVESDVLAKKMSSLSPIRWKGGFAVEVTPPPPISLVQGLRKNAGTWAALLEPNWAPQKGHWVVVDDVYRIREQEGLFVAVRDPIGFAYLIPADIFLQLWHYTFVVIEEKGK